MNNKNGCFINCIGGLIGLVMLLFLFPFMSYFGIILLIFVVCFIFGIIVGIVQMHMDNQKK